MRTTSKITMLEGIELTRYSTVNIQRVLKASIAYFMVKLNVVNMAIRKIEFFAI